MKKSCFFLLTLAAVATAQADDYPYLTFQTADGQTQSVATTELVITFADGNLVATDNNGATTTFPLSSLQKMYFASEASESTGIDLLSTAADEPVEVFTLTGISQGRYENLQQAQSTLAKGIYVVKGENRTFKISVK